MSPKTMAWRWALIFASIGFVPGVAIDQVLGSMDSPYLIESLRVSGGGLPVAGVEDGVIYPVGNEPCPPFSVCAAAPIAATRSTVRDDSPIVLEVALAGGDVIEESTSSCSWTLEPGPRSDPSCEAFEARPENGEATWRGWLGEIALPRPAKTGSYFLHLSCKTPESEPSMQFDSQLFVTYGEPLTVVSPPEADWYDRATCWAGGLDAGATEEQVLASTLKGIYAYGGEHWRYGYARQAGPGRYLFPLAQGEQEYAGDPSSLPICWPGRDSTGEPTTYCKCRWQGLVAPGGGCAFADCYIYSDVFHAMAAVMGVGGLRYSTVRGQVRAGLRTVPHPSLDGDFIGTGCDRVGEDCYQFIFSSHSLRQRDRTFFDSTFEGTYQTAEQPVELSTVPRAGGMLTFLDSPLTLENAGKGYGSWMFFSRPRPSFAFDTRSGALSYGKVRFSKHNRDKDGISEALRAEVEIMLHQEGEYLISGGLNKGSVAVARQPDWWSTEQTVAFVSGTAGSIHHVILDFSGQEIAEAALDGPWEFFAAVNGGGPSVRKQTRKYQSEKFGELQAVILRDVQVAGATTDGAGQTFDVLNIRVPFRVRSPGIFVLEARLAKQLTPTETVSIGYAGANRSFGKKWFGLPHKVDLQIPGDEIAAAGLDAPWQLTLVLYDEHLKAMTSEVLEIEDGTASSFR